MNSDDRQPPRADRTLPDDVIVDSRLDLDRLWRDFEIFEALHHSTTIANPFTSDDLDAVVDLMAPQDGETFLDVATGSGELLRRVTKRTGAPAVGVDLSPWMIRNAATHPTSPGSATWVVADGAALVDRGEVIDLAPTYGLIACLGASWIWHGLAGTIAAVAKRVSPCGRVAIGDMHLRAGIDPNDAPAGFRSGDGGDAASLLAANHLRLIGTVTASDEAWDDYIRQTTIDAERWQATFPGPDADRFVAEQREWILDHERDRPWRSWTVWVAQAP